MNTTTLILGVALTVVAGLFSSTIFGLDLAKTSTQTNAAASGLITGHVITTVTDSEGNLKAYRQSDNLIVNQGENCVIKMLFGANGGTSVGSGTNTCTGAITSGFRVIAIGNTTTTPASDQVSLANEYTASKGVPSLARQTASTVTITNSTGAGSGTVATAVISATFTNSQSTAQIVGESGLFNSTSLSTDGMFARQTFTNVTMNNGDSLTVQWTINVGGTTQALSP